MFYIIIIAYIRKLHFVLFLLALLHYYYHMIVHLILDFKFLFIYIKAYNTILTKIWK